MQKVGSPTDGGIGMADPHVLEEQFEETRSIIEELLEDGSDPDATYIIEHHFSAEDFDQLEKAAVEAFKLGYEVTDAEELETEDRVILMCCDVISESRLEVDLINAQVKQLADLAEKMGVNYDGWGTYFEDPNAPDDEDDNDDLFPPEEDEPRLH
ncbi:Regulator of ribonuclease activity B [Xenorhabdus nematophila F1]|nr:Regulator of ribonuclease activity B [Xenorhabdus nematophila F1]CEK21539.1 conserved hypothetical protein [Xenorhabdus nematophila AN6/1]